MTPDERSACPGCDLLQRLPPLAPNEIAKCPRCGTPIRRGAIHNVQLDVALALAALIMLAIANLFPLLSLELDGQHRDTTVAQGIDALWDGGREETALLVAAVTVIIPFVRASTVLFVASRLMFGHSPRRYRWWIRAVTGLTPWGMTEVYLLGALVAFVKLNDMASVVVGPALYAFAAMSVLSAFSGQHLDAQKVWSREAVAIA